MKNQFPDMDKDSPIKFTIKKNNILKRNDNVNTCLTDCVAYIFKLDSRKVPFFIKNKYWFRISLKRFVKKLGYEAVLHDGHPIIKGKYIASGKSPRSKAKTNYKNDRRVLYHACVYRNGKMIYDPAPIKNGISGNIDYCISFKKLTAN